MSLKKLFTLACAMLFLTGGMVHANPPKKEKDFLSTIFKNDPAYLFCYFTGNGEDGLHLMYSYDGLIWKTLNNGNALLKPTVGKAKLMRDPSIVRDSKGVFHMKKAST